MLLMINLLPTILAPSNNNQGAAAVSKDQTDKLYEEAYEALKRTREGRVSESRIAALCVLGGAVMAGVMALAVWVGAAIGGGV